MLHIKRLWLSALMSIMLLTACRQDLPAPQAAVNANHEPESVVTLEILNPKVEISTQFEQMTRDYERENPQVDIQVLTYGGGSNYLAELKARFAAGQGPDIFPNGGYQEAKAWSRYLEDLSDQPWVKDVYTDAIEPMTMNGKVYGMPINYEGYGFIYNKDLFRKAGIEDPPATFTALEAAAEKLQAAGITPFVNGYSDSWFFVLLLNIAFAQQDNPDAFIQGLYDGTQTIEGNARFEELLKLLDLTVRYGNPDYLTTDYNAEVRLFAAGQAAILKQGDWVQSKIDEVAPHLNIGFLPIPISDAPRNDVLALGVSNNFAVNKMSSARKKAEAKKFLNWMVSSERGKFYMKDQFHFISAYRSIGTDRSRPLVNELLRYREAGRTAGWHWFKFPAKAREEFGYAMQAYTGRQLDHSRLLRELQRSWQESVRE